MCVKCLSVRVSQHHVPAGAGGGPPRASDLRGHRTSEGIGPPRALDLLHLELLMVVSHPVGAWNQASPL